MAKGKIRKFTKSDRETVLRILCYIRSYRGLVLLSVLLAALTVVLTLYIPILTGHAVDVILEKGAVDFARLAPILRSMILLILLTAAAQWTMNHINNVVTYHVVEDIRTRTFNHLQELPVAYLDTHPSGDIVSRVIADIDQFSQGLLMGFTQLFTGVLTILETLGFLFFIEWRVAVLVVLLTPLSFLVAAVIARKSYHLFRQQSEARGALTAYTNEMVQNLKVVKAFSRESASEARFSSLNAELAGLSRRATFLSSIVNPSTRFVNAVVYAAVGTAGSLLVIGGVMSVGELSALLSYANQYTKPFNEISGVVTELQNALASASRVFELLDEPALCPDEPDAAAFPAAEGRVDLNHVFFSYDKTKKLLCDVDVHVRQGETVAIVGPTGCGKSTLINLLMRFYDPDSGSIELDGLDTRRMKRESLRDSFGMVLQETWLKAATIRDNIAYGRPEATDEEVIAAARKAHCDSFIRKMPKGYRTVLGEGGGSLSQGQKQLLCIARLMLRLPPMLILDEATSFIDTRTELHIQHAFDRMMEGRTAFIVAHRLSTIRNADLILVMKDGNIIEKGSHETLLAAGGFYRELYNSQFYNSESGE
ncbi:MAG: ABC transporter ATP-binding protein [Oribacterium sp.]